jgi:hypothetical protein
MSTSPKSPSAIKLANAVRRVAMTSALAAPVEKKRHEALESHLLFEISSGRGFRYQRRYRGFFVEATLVSNAEAFTPLSPQALSGNEVTQTGRPDSKGITVWNHLIDLHFAISQPSAAWPKLRLKISVLDAHGRILPVGYGLAVLPSQPGNFRFEVPCWRPAGAGIFEEMRALISGAAPALADANVVEAPGGRKGLRTVGCGTVEVRGCVVLRRADVHGVTAKAG